jgi:hypothetical protein
MRSNVEKQLLRINFWFLGPFADEQHIWTDLPPDNVVRTRKHLDPVQTAEANHNDAGQTTSSWLSKYSTAGASFSPESIVQLAATGQLPPSIEDRLRTGTNHDSTSTVYISGVDLRDFDHGSYSCVRVFPTSICIPTTGFWIYRSPLTNKWKNSIIQSSSHDRSSEQIYFFSFRSSRLVMN